MPSWVYEGVNEYRKRLHDSIAISIIEIPLQRRGKSSDIARIMEKEMLEMQAAIPANAHIVALEINGESFTSEGLAEKLNSLQMHTSHLCFLIGGPEGLSPLLVAKSHAKWSLSKLTMPHPIVRIVLMEAIYRAWSILHNHPYHK
ncbi:rRNA large subunit methyltransferase [Legionella adelaidensis]|uniref:Ribosomal RNA large subunit methyltransferase H n=2 Tax=Legionella adelaidensis TaxID=45056 RepID=A0A0W0R4T3_9GAMM|nr:rRNA large subunit methyltransferase [Legionella adelaidensis]